MQNTLLHWTDRGRLVAAHCHGLLATLLASTLELSAKALAFVPYHVAHSGVVTTGAA